MSALLETARGFSFLEDKLSIDRVERVVTQEQPRGEGRLMAGQILELARGDQVFEHPSLGGRDAHDRLGDSRLSGKHKVPV